MGGKSSKAKQGHSSSPKTASSASPQDAADALVKRVLDAAISQASGSSGGGDDDDKEEDSTNAKRKAKPEKKKKKTKLSSKDGVQQEAADPQAPQHNKRSKHGSKPDPRHHEQASSRTSRASLLGLSDSDLSRIEAVLQDPLIKGRVSRPELESICSHLNEYNGVLTPPLFEIVYDTIAAPSGDVRHPGLLAFRAFHRHKRLTMAANNLAAERARAAKNAANKNKKKDETKATIPSLPPEEDGMTFEEFVRFLAIMVRGSTSERIAYCFPFSDTDNFGSLDLEQLESFIGLIPHNHLYHKFNIPDALPSRAASLDSILETEDEEEEAHVSKEELSKRRQAERQRRQKAAQNELLLQMYRKSRHMDDDDDVKESGQDDVEDEAQVEQESEQYKKAHQRLKLLTKALMDASSRGDGRISLEDLQFLFSDAYAVAPREAESS